MNPIIEKLKNIQGRMCYLRSRLSPSLLVIILLAVAVIWTNYNNHLWKEKHGVVIHDVVGYYSYLPAAIIQHDLKFDFISAQPENYFGHIIRLRTPEGGIYQKMTMGLAFLYLPFFLIGHVQALLTGVPATGFTEPYMYWLVFSSMFYGIAGLLLLRKILKMYFSEKLTAFVLLIVTAGTNLFFYLTLEAPMSHAYNFFLFILFVWLTMRWYERKDVKTSLFLGLNYGLIGLIRPTNGLIVLFFLLYNIRSFSDISARIQLFLSYWKNILLVILMSFLVVLPQLIFWKMNTGSWFYYTYGEEGFFFNNPQIFRGLFSYRKGWLLYTPVMIFGLAGIFSLRKKAEAFFVPVLVFMLINIYVIYSWWDWTYGGSFGSRPMIDAYGLMALGIAAITDSVFDRKKLYGIVLQVVLTVLMAFNIFQILQYKYATIHFANMTKEAYWHGFGKLRADSEFYDKLEPMDYAALKKGIYKTKPMLRSTIGPDAVNDFETLTADSNHYFSPDQRYKFLSFRSQCNAEALSGQNAGLLTADKSFTSGIDFPVRQGQKYHITVWKKPANANAALAFSSADTRFFYELNSVPDTINAQGWARLSIIKTIPDRYDGWCKVYVWNKGQDSVFFDDLCIRKLE